MAAGGDGQEKGTGFHHPYIIGTSGRCMFERDRRLIMARVAVQHTRPHREPPTARAIAPRAQSVDAIRNLSASWQEREGHFPCEVSAARQFTVAASVSPERFTSLQVALLVDPAPRPGHASASALASKISLLACEQEVSISEASRLVVTRADMELATSEAATTALRATHADGPVAMYLDALAESVAGARRHYERADPARYSSTTDA
jgi:hypothetical protein